MIKVSLNIGNLGKEIHQTDGKPSIKYPWGERPDPNDYTKRAKRSE